MPLYFTWEITFSMQEVLLASASFLISNIKIIKKEMFTNPSQALDSQTNSPLHYHRKCIENSEEN